MRMAMARRSGREGRLRWGWKGPKRGTRRCCVVIAELRAAESRGIKGQLSRLGLGPGSALGPWGLHVVGNMREHGP